MAARTTRLKRFDFAPGRVIAGKYRIESLLGSGWEGEVYVIIDRSTVIRRQGIGFEVKLLDFFDLGRPSRSKIHKDVLNLTQVFYSLTGGHKHYATQPKVVKDIIRGQKDSLILKRFQSAADIQRHLENLQW